ARLADPRRARAGRPVVDPLPERVHARGVEPQGRRLLRGGDVLLLAARREDAGGQAMAITMRTASPWWASLAFGGGLFLVFLGERLFGHLPGIRLGLTG